MGNYHVPFWRAVEEATPSLTLILSRAVGYTVQASGGIAAPMLPVKEEAFVL